MRTPTIALGLLSETEGLSSGEAELMHSGSGSCAAVSPAQCVPSVAAVGGDVGVRCPLRPFLRAPAGKCLFRPGHRCAWGKSCMHLLQAPCGSPLW